MREERNARKLERETAEERQTRLNRQRNPPTRSAKVFEWLPSDDGPDVVVRRAVPSNQRFDVLSSYTASQKRYDAFSNEWDCCDALSPGDIVDDDMEDVIEYTMTQGEIDPEIQEIPPPPPPDNVDTPSAPNSCSTVAPTRSEGGESEDYTVYPSEPLEVLWKFYGFVPPLPLPTETSSNFREGAQRTKLLYWMGEENFPDSFVKSS
jgi:hypothetical protein